MCEGGGLSFIMQIDRARRANSGRRICIMPRLLKDGQLNQIVFNFFCGMAASLFNVEN